MRPYGSRRDSVLRRQKSRATRWEDSLCGDGPVKGSERLRTRTKLQKALGPVPPSLTAKDEPPCTCEDCTSDPAFAAYVRELEQEEHSHLDEIQV